MMLTVAKANPDISVSKTCRAMVEVKDSLVVARVDIKGLVCNTGDTSLSGVMAYEIADSGIVTDPDPLVNGISLLAPADPQNPTIDEGACVEYTGSYYPSKAKDLAGYDTECASNVIFKDTVMVEAMDIMGQSLTPETDMADCHLCTEGPCTEYSD